MDAQLRRAVFRLCLEGAAEQALRLIRRAGQAAWQDPASRSLWFRLMGDALAAADRPRSAAAAYWRALRIQRALQGEVAAADWGPLAAVYRELWRRTGDARYLRRYLRFSRERTDEVQTLLARRGLDALRHGRCLAVVSARSARNP